LYLLESSISWLSVAKGLSKNQLLISLIFSNVFLVSTISVSAQIVITSFVLLPLGLSFLELSGLPGSGCLFLPEVREVVTSS